MHTQRLPVNDLEGKVEYEQGEEKGLQLGLTHSCEIEVVEHATARLPDLRRAVFLLTFVWMSDQMVAVWGVNTTHHRTHRPV